MAQFDQPSPEGDQPGPQPPPHPPPPGYQPPPPGYQPPPPGYGPPPGPDPRWQRWEQERTWAMFCHLAAFAGYVGVPLGSILGPLVVWLIKRNEFPFVNDQGKQSLNFHISIVLYMACGFLLLFLPLVLGALAGVFAVFGLFPGWFLLVLSLGVLDVIFTIIAAIRANRGEAYRYPLAIPFFR